MAEKTRNTIIVLEPSAKSAQELLKLLVEKDVADIITVSTPEDALQSIVAHLPCMFLTSINDNQEVPVRVQLFKRLESAIKQHGLKVYVVTPIKNRQLSDMITQKMGVSDYIVEPVPVRTMQFKANLQLKAVDSFRRQQELKKASEEKVVIKKLDNGKKVDPAAGGSEVKTNGKPALQAGNDTFLFKNSGVRKAGKKFTVELEGPDPSTGEWVPHEDKGDAQTSWRWVPNEEKEQQAKGEAPKDGWVHKGDKPAFNENSQKWAMTSETPSLSLQEKGKTVAEKMGLDEAGEVFVAEDSPAAEENLKRNRAKAESEKKVKELNRKALRGHLGGDTDPENPESLAAGEGTEGEAAPILAKGTKPAAEKAKPPSLRALFGEEGEDGARAGELQDKRDPGAKKSLAELRDKRGKIDEKLDEIVPQAAAKPGEDGEEERIAESDSAEEDSDDGDLDNRDGPARTAAIKALKNRGKSGAPGEADAPPVALRDKRAKDPNDGIDRLRNLLSDDEETEAGKAADELLAALGESDEEGTGGEGKPGLGAAAAPRGRKGGAKREDPASRLAELNDLQSEGAGARLLGLKDQRAALMDKMQDLLNEPLPETVSAEEEEALREELGLKGRPEIKAKDLAKRKRLKDAKNLKSKLAELEDELRSEEEEQGEASSAISRADEPEATPVNRGDLSADKLTGIRGAFDNGEDPAEAEEENRKRLKNKLEDKKRKADRKDRAEYLPEADIQPLGNAWDSADTHYVYLDATVRYKGFAKLEDLLPLWIFEGEDVPQLLDKTKQWRFLGGLPFQARTVADIPKSVRDFLVGLRDQLRRAGVDVPGSDVDPVGDLLAGDEDAETAGDIAGDEAEPAEAGRKKGDKARDKARSLKDILGGDDEEEATEAEAETPAEEDPGEPTEENVRTLEDFRAEQAIRTQEREKQNNDDKIARLKAELGMDQEPAEEPDEALAEASDATADSGPADGEEKPETEAATEAAPAPAGSLAGSKSSAVQSFLERRKKKLEEGQPETRPDARARDPHAGYLGIYVALSDAYGGINEPAIALTRVLGSVEGSFKDCVAFVTSAPDESGKVAVLHHSRDQASPGERLELAGGLSEPIQRTRGESGEVLGYLYLKSAGPRQRFDEQEEATFRKLATKIWPLVFQADVSSKRNAA